MNWEFRLYGKKPKLNDPVLVEGLPGIGNVGKIVVDFLIDELKAKPLYNIFSYSLPNSVYVNEDNLVDLPIIEMYYVKHKKQDILLLAGDVQPIDEAGCYTFCEQVLDDLESFGGKRVVTIGGIGLDTPPKKAKIYCTGNIKKVVKEYKKGTCMKDNLYGIVGPIVGVSGVLVGLSSRRNMEGVSILAETFRHPMYLGMKGAREILKVLVKKFGLKVSIKKIDKEIKEMEQDLFQRSEELLKVAQKNLLGQSKDRSYIG